MHRWRRAKVATVGVLLAVSSLAQTPQYDPLAVLQRFGSLTVWVVGPPVEASVLAEVGVPRPTEFREQTNASFGQTSGSFGKSLSDIGVSSDSPTLTAPQSPPGANAPTPTSPTTGFHEVTTAELGQKAGNFAQVTAANARAAKPVAESAKDALDWTKLPWARKLYEQSRVAFPRLELDIVRVPANDLQRKLEATAPESYPDVVLGDPLPIAWSRPRTGLAQRYGLAWLGKTELIPQDEAGRPGSAVTEVTVLQRAPHLVAAKAFALWSHNTREGAPPWQPWSLPQTDPPVVVAVRALSHLLMAEPLGDDADSAMSPYDPLRAQVAGLSYTDPLANLQVHIGVAQVQYNERLAVVMLQASLEATGAFGGVNTLVVLRCDSAGHWRVLKMTPNQGAGQTQNAYAYLSGYAVKVAPEKVAQVKAVAPASPVDGDVRAPLPELWWDNAADAQLEAVEWQNRGPTSDTHLFFIPDTFAKESTRAVASFAAYPGLYRWRMWSVGTGGGIALSPWRTMTIAPR